MTSPRDHALDGLRGIAALMVVLSHVASMTWTPFADARTPLVWEYALWHLGAPAVDLFFVLSGFVVARSLMRHRQDYAPFILSRAIRLYPIAWAGVLAGLALRNLHPAIPLGMSAGIADLNRAMMPSDVLGFATLSLPIPHANLLNPPLWSLVYEIQAAAAMPLLAMAAWRWPRATAPMVVAALCVVALASNLAYPLLFSGFAIGAALAALEARIPRAPRPAAVLALGLAILMVRHGLATDDPLLRPVCAAGAGLVVLAVRQGAGRRWLSGRAPRRLGRISYPIYAVHWPIMATTAIAFGPSTGFAAAALASIPASMAAAHFLERRIDVPAVTLSHLVKSRKP